MPIRLFLSDCRRGALDALYMIRLYTGLYFTDIRYIGKKHNASHNNNNDYHSDA